jgi:hypothetical protein
VRLGRQAVAVLLGLVGCGVLGYTAVALAAPVSAVTVPLTQGQINSVKEEVDRAITDEQTALRRVRERELGAVAPLLKSHSQLTDAIVMLKDNDLGTSEEETLLNKAFKCDDTAIDDVGKDEWSAARHCLVEGLEYKRQVLFGVDHWQPPAPTPTPSGSSIEDCSFNPAVGQLEVKVSWQGEGGATVHVAVGPSSNQLTTTLNASGVGYVGPFTIQAGATYPIFIQASNPTTGKTAQATATGFQGSSTATDCQVQGG